MTYLAEVRFRLLRQIEELGYGSEVEERIHILDFGDRKPQVLTDPWARQVLTDRIRQHRATFATLDPLVGLHDRDENSNPQMRAVLDAVTPIAEETGCTFIFVHHEPKNPENNSAASRGASAIRDWCRTMLRLSSQKPGPGGVRRFSLDLDKANYGGTVYDRTLERKQDSYIFTAIDPDTAVSPKRVWELLGQKGGWFDEVQEKLMEEFGVSKTSAYRALKKAEEAKLVVVESRVNPETKRTRSYLSREKTYAA